MDFENGGMCPFEQNEISLYFHLKLSLLEWLTTFYPGNISMDFILAVYNSCKFIHHNGVRPKWQDGENEKMLSAKDLLGQDRPEM